MPPSTRPAAIIVWWPWPAAGLPPVPTAEKQFLDARARRLIAENPETDGKKLAEQIREGLERVLAATAARAGDRTDRLSRRYSAESFAGAGLLPRRMPCTATTSPLPCGHRGRSMRPPPRPRPGRLPGRATRPFSTRPAPTGSRRPTASTPPAADPSRAVTDGTCEVSATRGSVDCVVSADPVTALLVMSGRLSQWAAVALGRLTFWVTVPRSGHGSMTCSCSRSPGVGLHSGRASSG